MTIIFRLHTVESERGWGQTYDHIDFYTYEEAKKEYDRINSKNKSGQAPDWYYQADRIEAVNIPYKAKPNSIENVKENTMSNISDAEYRGNMDCAMEDVALMLTNLGVIEDDDTSHTDAQLIELTVRKMQMLYEMVKASGMNENILKAVMKG